MATKGWTGLASAAVAIAAFGGEAENPILPVAEKMSEVERSMAREETGPIVQARIGEIIAELDRLIRELEKERPPVPPHPPGPGPGVPGLEVPLPVNVREDAVMRRVPIPSEKDAVQRVREGGLPAEYEAVTASYFRELASTR